MLQKVNELHEANPMLGLRGVRLGIVKPGLYAMQVRAIFEAAAQVRSEGGDPKVEVMIPLVATAPELRQMREELEPVAAESLGDVELSHLEWGTMVELPRAAVTAGEIAETAEFFSFGTNDLTQTAFGFSRDDIGKFVGMYEERKLVPANPFVTIDVDGVGRLMRIAADEGRAANQAAAPRDLRRARRRPGERGVLPRDRPRLRELLALPGGDGAPRGRPGGGRRLRVRLEVAVMPLFPWLGALQIGWGLGRALQGELERFDEDVEGEHFGVHVSKDHLELARLQAQQWQSDREEQAKLARSRWLEANRAERSFPCGVVPDPVLAATDPGRRRPARRRGRCFPRTRAGRRRRRRWIRGRRPSLSP